MSVSISKAVQGLIEKLLKIELQLVYDEAERCFQAMFDCGNEPQTVTLKNVDSHPCSILPGKMIYGDLLLLWAQGEVSEEAYFRLKAILIGVATRFWDDMEILGAMNLTEESGMLMRYGEKHRGDDFGEEKMTQKLAFAICVIREAEKLAV
jgi:hypothetical protein